jgi:hypothetical protein
MDEDKENGQEIGFDPQEPAAEESMDNSSHSLTKCSHWCGPADSQYVQQDAIRQWVSTLR